MLFMFLSEFKTRLGWGSVPSPVSNPPPVVSPVTSPTIPPRPVPQVLTGPITYVIAPGDNLYSIAKRFHTTLDAIVHLNNITTPDMIYPGQVLVIPQ
jgi:5'-nucleotidase / UDP-sugar diphosphatase